MLKKMRLLALSGRFASSSPKGRASGETENFAWTAKASPFERLPPGRWHESARRGQGGIAQAMTERARPFIKKAAAFGDSFRVLIYYF
ncbi:hypothetical protein DXA70_11475 [Faecalibacterium sp. OF04-11AC]|nr:hypothetical protein DXA70_11475 [Faecalibacterium sp. OF04-11AC]